MATLADHAYQALHADLISGAIPAGMPLRLEALKARYGVSFSPIREALNRLHGERLVEITGSRGFRAAPLSDEAMWDAIETRILVDGQALRRAIACGDAQWEAALAGALHALDRLGCAPAPADLSGGVPDPFASFEHWHQLFHQRLLAACDSPCLLDLSARMSALTERYRQPALRLNIRRSAAYGFGLADRGREVQQEHQALFDAAVARDADRAVALLAEHFRETGRQLQRLAISDAAAAA